MELPNLLSGPDKSHPSNAKRTFFQKPLWSVTGFLQPCTLSLAARQDKLSSKQKPDGRVCFVSSRELDLIPSTGRPSQALPVDEMLTPITAFAQF
ncbi:hypothetical protein VTL71DRAFT_5487, partial [Oculimacula yallundae]